MYITICMHGTGTLGRTVVHVYSAYAILYVYCSMHGSVYVHYYMYAWDRDSRTDCGPCIQCLCNTLCVL